MRCIAVPEPTLQTLVEEAEALDRVLLVLAHRQVPAVAGQLAALRVSLRTVSRIYHDAVEDGEEANHVVLQGPEAEGRNSTGHG
jgi:hypothetical protein